MSRKLAPTLAEMVKRQDYAENGYDASQSLKEFRALLSVARAADRSIRAVIDLSDGSWQWGDVPVGDPDGDLARALARLRRLSSPTRRK